MASQLIKFINISISLLLFLLVINSCQQGEDIQDISDSLNHKDSLELTIQLDSLTHTSISDKDSLKAFSDAILNQFSSAKDLINIKIAHIHFSHSNYLLAQEYFKNAADYYLTKNLIEKQAEQITNIGVTKEMSGDYTEAIKDYLYSLNVFDSLNIPLKKSYAYNNIGIVYQQMGKFPEALNYYKKSLQIAQDLKLTKLKANRCNNIASLYEEGFDNIDSAFYYYEKAHNIYSTDTNSNQSPIIENNIGHIYFRKGEYEKADSIYNKALKYALKYQLDNIVSSIYRNQAELLAKQKHFSLAEEKAKLASSIAQKQSFREMELKSLKVLTEILELNKDYKNANIYLKKYHLLKDELSGIEEQNLVNKLSLNYQLKEKEHLIQVLELKTDIQSRKLWQLWLLIITLLFLLGGLFFIFRLQRKNNRMRTLQMQRDISDYISQIEEIKEDKEKTQKYSLQKTKGTSSKTNILKQLKEFNLSEREEDVLLLIAQGYKNAEIAEKLFLSINTIKTHTKNIFIKLDVRNRIEASRKAQII